MSQQHYAAHNYINKSWIRNKILSHIVNSICLMWILKIKKYFFVAKWNAICFVNYPILPFTMHLAALIFHLKNYWTSKASVQGCSKWFLRDWNIFSWKNSGKLKKISFGVRDPLNTSLHLSPQFNRITNNFFMNYTYNMWVKWIEANIKASSISLLHSYNVIGDELNRNRHARLLVQYKVIKKFL